jgi:hypothetical protein
MGIYIMLFDDGRSICLATHDEIDGRLKSEWRIRCSQSYKNYQMQFSNHFSVPVFIFISSLSASKNNQFL